uniref:Dual specificity protein phosphatase 15 n=1 Tax=Trichuris muris TaxID=70415 RepID=A0A5S6QYP7_TRIMR
MNLVLRGLYVGSCRDARDERALTEKKISHIVSVHDRARPFNDGRQQLVVNISDQESENILEHVSTVNDFIHRARLTGGCVLVHCMLGISRSVTFVIAYVMSVTSLGWREALQVVRSTRHRASPNFGFKRQLQAFEKDFVESERRRLMDIDVAEGLILDDRNHCQRALLSYMRWVQFGDLLMDEHESLLIEKLSET